MIKMERNYWNKTEDEYFIKMVNATSIEERNKYLTLLYPKLLYISSFLYTNYFKNSLTLNQPDSYIYDAIHTQLEKILQLKLDKNKNIFSYITQVIKIWYFRQCNEEIKTHRKHSNIDVYRNAKQHMRLSQKYNIDLMEHNHLTPKTPEEIEDNILYNRNKLFKALDLKIKALDSWVKEVPDSVYKHRYFNHKISEKVYERLIEYVDFIKKFVTEEENDFDVPDLNKAFYLHTGYSEDQVMYCSLLIFKKRGRWFNSKGGDYKKSKKTEHLPEYKLISYRDEL